MTHKIKRPIRWLAATSWLWLVASVACGGYLLATAHSSSAPTTPKSNSLAFAGQPSVAPANAATRPIESIRVGMRVLGSNPDSSEVDETLPDPVAADWRHLSLRMEKENGDALRIELLRPMEWLSFFEVAVGKTIDLDLSEMGAEGPAEVLAVAPCPTIQPGSGNVVTGTFAHRSSGDLVNLQVAGEPRPTGVTRNHRYWSEDRHEFVAAGELRLGERLLTATGDSTTLVSRTSRPIDEPVYNLEVHREHVYLVGETGVLVHNNYGEVLFGQRRISERFRRDGKNDLLRGEKVSDIAQLLREGFLKSDDIRINYFKYKGKIYAESNRGLAALSMAGLKPTNLVEVTATKNLKKRVDEMLDEGRHGTMMPVTVNKKIETHVYSIFLPK